MQASRLSFVWVLGIQTQALLLAQQMVFPLNHLPISLIIFYLFVLCFEMEGGLALYTRLAWKLLRSSDDLELTIL